MKEEERMFKSSNSKVSAKRLNSVADKAYMVGSEVLPLKGQRTMMAKDKVSMVRVGEEGYPALDIDCEGKGVALPRIRNVFNGKEELELEVRDGTLIVSMGRNRYRFPLMEDAKEDAGMPRLTPSATFFMEPKELAKLAKGANYVRLEAGYSQKRRQKTVFVSFYDKEGGFLKGIDLEVPWEGTEAASEFPADEIADWGNLGGRAEVGLSDDSPIQLDGSGDGVPYRYLLAPTITYPGQRTVSDAEREWIASRNEGRRRLPAGASVKEADRRRIEEVFGSRQRFFERMDGLMAHGCPSPFDAAYVLFSDARNTTQRWVVADYLSRTIGPGYRSYGDEFEVYARLLARDGASMYEERRGPKRTAKKGSTEKSGNAKRSKGTKRSGERR